MGELNGLKSPVSDISQHACWCGPLQYECMGLMRIFDFLLARPLTAKVGQCWQPISSESEDELQFLPVYDERGRSW